MGVLTKADLYQSATRWAQGGVAAVLSPDEDSTDLHLADTLAAGAGLCDVDAVRVLVDEGAARVHDLISLGAVFDRDPSGALDLAREGGHSQARVVHAGGLATGAEIERALVDAVHETAAAVLEGWFALDLLVEGGRCRGVVALDPEGVRHEVRATHTLLATGGAGQLFAVTTNPAQATGDGIAMALRAGVPVADVEFMQFHPTALHHPAMPRPLLSEALRGHGALIRNSAGERFVDELLPRDKVSQAITTRMLEEGVEHEWLDATGLERFDERFPTIAASVRSIGLDPATDWLPIAPAAHHLSGGVLSDLDGATALPGLWAVGEVADVGVHGANRLASNSLLEGMVFGPRVVDALERGKDAPDATGALRAVLGGDVDIPGRPVGGEVVEPKVVEARPEDVREHLQQAMTLGAGVVRTAGSLELARQTLMVPTGDTPAVHEVRNLVTVGEALVRAALARTESRGNHWRSDHPAQDEALRVRLVHSRA
ncbi:MAG: L-aspartate oxidase [Acidimicrobiales bacterium]|nr:L-aspartate oxidase [Acidimicrobiales bacterium]